MVDIFKILYLQKEETIEKGPLFGSEDRNKEVEFSFGYYGRKHMQNSFDISCLQ